MTYEVVLVFLFLNMIDGNFTDKQRKCQENYEIKNNEKLKKKRHFFVV